MLGVLLASIWFFLPAGVGNAAPIFAAKLPFVDRWSYPIDLGVCWRGVRLLGSHKTWRGLVAGMVMSTVALWLEQLLWREVSVIHSLALALPGFEHYPTLLLGPVLGLSALAGDAIKSFFKRRTGIAPGKSWFPFDQVDYIAGAILGSLLVVPLSAGVYLAALILWPLIHIASTYIGHFLHLKEAAI